MTRVELAAAYLAASSTFDPDIYTFKVKGKRYFARRAQLTQLGDAIAAAPEYLRLQTIEGWLKKLRVRS